MSSEEQKPLDGQSESIPTTASIDSSTVLLNPQSDPTTDNTSRPSPQRSNTDLKQCWICYVDETEDTPTTSRWRSPCPCALVAHESCLLDWVADLEAPGSRQARTSAPKIQCPQCKKDIIIARPRSYVVEATKAVERFGSRLVVPGIALALGGSVYTGATMHGITSMFMIFGKKDFERLLGGPHLAPKWLAVFPMIPVALILSRTSLADQIAPSVPLLIWASGLPQSWGAYSSPQIWPPTPEMAFSALPFIRSVYRQLWRTFFAKKEAEWVKQVQPRAGEATEDTGEAADHEPAGENGGLDIFNFQVEIVEEEEEIVAEPEAQGEDAAPVPAEGNAEQNNNEEQGGQPRQRQQPRGLTVSGTYIADIIMGALAFPAIASAMGQLLKYGLPGSWTSPPTYILKLGFGGKQTFTSTTRPPFLASQWARSLVGGCLFVVMKDTLLLYSKYRTAKDHQKRRVLNWDKKLGRIVD